MDCRARFLVSGLQRVFRCSIVLVRAQERHRSSADIFQPEHVAIIRCGDGRPVRSVNGEALLQVTAHIVDYLSTGTLGMVGVFLVVFGRHFGNIIWFSGLILLENFLVAVVRYFLLGHHGMIAAEKHTPS